MTKEAVAAALFRAAELAFGQSEGDIDGEYYLGIVAARSLLDRREVHLRRMLFGNLRLAVTSEPHGWCYEGEYCFHSPLIAWLAYITWQGDEDVPPIGFAKNASTGERGPGFLEPSERGL